jgi:hypothetical protein
MKLKWICCVSTGVLEDIYLGGETMYLSHISERS